MDRGASPNAPEPEPDGPLLTPLGAFMQRRNAELGLSVAAVAQRVGMSRATWYRIARGECASPGLRLLRGLARVYKVRAAEVFALAADVDPRSSLTHTTAPDTGRQAGDALWRCGYDRRVRAGTWVDVHIELQNLSDRPWVGAELRGLHDAWLCLPDGPAPSTQFRAGDERQTTCRETLAPTRPGEWVATRMLLRAPLAVGRWVFCMALNAEPAGNQPAGPGLCLLLETH